MTHPTYLVIRRCAPGECAPDCNCALIPVDVGADELTPAECEHFAVHGTAEQRADVAEYMGEVAA